MEVLNDSQIIEQLKAGNKEAFEALFKKYYKLLNVSAYYILRDEMEAEDTVQGFFVDLWEAQLFNNINSSLKAYMTTAVRNRCLKKVESETRTQKSLVDYKYTLTEVEEEETHIPEIFPDKLLADLSMQRMQAFTLVHYENKRYKDAAYEMGISINSLKTHLKLAVKTLKAGIKSAK
ncbi:RNA polymerase sigma-70 factor (ECF subfamily) [Mucilaginibacter oryzae]|uniref:RNA polymerase sigma-70 factor (ECF subfamily) n=1 Tax=Mucilaginibacter oryzae TaxID=468058 RepID=A0A316HF89_9SPHI|nr:sigma-70 family RNA polymerase sigma factor [Mucilaginibacter oryzae]PWK79077.1 RNA polymerase sigma-70 factor (ECF subfamily) [Mucilaginibacter oryzae]